MCISGEIVFRLRIKVYNGLFRYEQVILPEIKIEKILFVQKNAALKYIWLA